jgi:hypothetical protein
MFIASMPSRVRSAVGKRLKHCDARTFFLMKRVLVQMQTLADNQRHA